MRDLTIEELGHVYGAGGYGYKNKPQKKGHNKNDSGKNDSGKKNYSDDKGGKSDDKYHS